MNETRRLGQQARIAHDLAELVWSGLHRIERWGRPAESTCVVNGPTRFHGLLIEDQYRVLLHSETGPIHWVVFTKCGNVLTF